MATHVVRKGSIYRTGVVLKTKTKLYFYRMWCGISYIQNYYSVPNPIPLPFHYIIWIWKALKLCTFTQTPNHLVWIIFWINILPPFYVWVSVHHKLIHIKEPILQLQINILPSCIMLVLLYILYYLHLQTASWRCKQYIPLKHCSPDHMLF